MQQRVWGTPTACLTTAMALVASLGWVHNADAAAPKGNGKAEVEVDVAPDEAEATEETADQEADDADAAPEESAAAAPAEKTRKTKTKKERKKARSPAAPMKGRVGFGASRTLAGLNGLFVRWYAVDRLTIGFNLGAATFSHRDTDENGEFERTRTVGALGAGPELFFWPYQGDRSQQVHADFGIGTRVSAYFGFLGRLEEEQEDTLDTPLEIDIEVPASIQLFIGKRVAVIPEFGVAFRIIPGNREPDQNGMFDSNPGRGLGSQRGTSDGPGFGFDLGDHGGLFMGIGFAYFFGSTD